MEKKLTPSKSVIPAVHLPGTLVDYWSTHADDEHPIWGKWLSGSLMHCDITGFTAMSEALGEMGKEGAELMATILNRFFERMLGIAEQWYGIQMKFGGDAMLLLFSGSDHARNAAMCADEMQSAMKEFRRVAVLDSYHQLKMRIGIHSGHFYSASVGQNEGYLHYLLFGADVNIAAQVEPHASPGQVVASDATVNDLGEGFSVSTTKVHGIWRVNPSINLPILESKFTPPPESREVLYRYLLPPLANGLISNLVGEHRRVTTVFVNVLGASEILNDEGEAEALKQTNNYLSLIIDTLEKYGGYLAASDVSEEGEKLLILFGAPISLNKQEESALLFVEDFEKRLAKSPNRLKHKIGINTGFSFAGEIGSKKRKEYTVIGDSVNLAARLMGKAKPGEAIISALTANRGGDQFLVKRKRSVRVKGKSAPISIYQYLGKKELNLGTSNSRDFFTGRKAEFQRIRKVAATVKRGGFSLFHVYGEPGIGKTGLYHEVQYILKSEGWVTLEGHGQSYLVNTPFSIWLQPLMALFSILPSDDNDQALHRIRIVTEDLAPEYKDFYPLIAEILSVDFPKNEIMEALDARERHEKRMEVIVSLFSGLCSHLPVFLLIDNYQWVDESSTELLNAFAEKQVNSFFIGVSSRNSSLGLSEAVRKSVEKMPLQELNRDDAKNIVRYYMMTDDETRVMEITKKAKGNPLFLKELAEAATLGGGELPATINDVIMVKVDNLDQRTRSLLRLAAVIGSEFEKATLKSLVEKEHGEKYLEADLQTLFEDGFLISLDEEKPYQFSNNLTWEVVYETLLFVDRRKVHQQVAKTLEERFKDNLAVKAGALAYHYEKAGNVEEAIYHTAVAGDNAARLFAVKDALEFYHKALSFLDSFKDMRRVEKSALQEKIADIQFVAGNSTEAAKSLLDSLEIWRESKKRRKLRNLPWHIVSLERESMLCKKLCECYREDSSYETSLQWAEEGLTSLPQRANSSKSKLYFAKSATYFRMGNLKETISWANKSKQLAKKLKDKEDSANASKMIGLVYMWEGKTAEAIKEHGESSAIYSELNSLPGIGTSNANLGVCYQLTGDLDRASIHYQQALNAYSKLQNQMQIAAVSNNQGEVLLTRGKIDESISNLENTVKIGESAGALPLAGLALVNLCRCYVEKKDFEHAESYIRRAIRMLNRTGAEQLLAEARIQQVELEIHQGEIERAFRKGKKLLRELMEGDTKVLTARIFRHLAEIYLQKNDLTKAMEHIEKSLEIASEIDAKHDLARSLVIEAKILSQYRDKNDDAVYEKVSKAIDLFNGMGAYLEAQTIQNLLLH